MKKVTLVLLFFVLLLACQSEPEFKPLLNGQDLSGWFVQGGDIQSWQFADGMLSCVKPGGGWLTTEQEYANFILRVDWRIPVDGNSGVGLRYPKDSHVAHDGMEIQILDDSAAVVKFKDIKDEQFTGSIYYQVAGKRGVANRPGQWNNYEITCDGPQVTVKLNDVVVSEANMDAYTTGKGNRPPLSVRLRKGHVGVQSHGSRVDFKNIEICVLPE